LWSPLRTWKIKAHLARNKLSNLLSKKQMGLIYDQEYMVLQTRSSSGQYGKKIYGFMWNRIQLWVILSKEKAQKKEKYHLTSRRKNTMDEKKG
jgi:hypothetical protein